MMFLSLKRTLDAQGDNVASVYKVLRASLGTNKPILTP